MSETLEYMTTSVRERSTWEVLLEAVSPFPRESFPQVRLSRETSAHRPCT